MQLHNDHSNPIVPLIRPHDKSSLRNMWKVAEQEIGESWLVAKSSENSNELFPFILKLAREAYVVFH
jgi:hypothetical protein